MPMVLFHERQHRVPFVWGNAMIPGAGRIRLGVNVDHVATLRNARGGTHPDPVEAALCAIAAGADGITIHLREDRRHIKDADLGRMMAGIGATKLNLEMAATAEMLDIARAARPHAACLVPERRAEITTEGGLDAAGQIAVLAPVVAGLADAGIRVSLFIDPDAAQLRAAAALRAPVVELHTGAWAAGRPGALAALQQAAELAETLGLECHAGHGLDYDNVGPVARIAQIRELNIGHFLIGQAVLDGLAPVIARMRRCIDAARVGG